MGGGGDCWWNVASQTPFQSFRVIFVKHATHDPYDILFVRFGQSDSELCPFFKILVYPYHLLFCVCYKQCKLLLLLLYTKIRFDICVYYFIENLEYTRSMECLLVMIYSPYTGYLLKYRTYEEGCLNNELNAIKIVSIYNTLNDCQ